MKVKNSDLDWFVYTVLCVASLGFVWVCRVILSQAIRYALTDNPKQGTSS